MQAHSTTDGSPEPRSSAPRWSHTTLPEDAGGCGTVLAYLCRRFPGVSADGWAARAARGDITDDSGQPIGAGTPYRVKLRVRYRREVPAEPVIPFREDVLFVNDDILVADKPHFLPVVPSGPWVNECLLYRLLRRTGLSDLVPVHRLDRETAGLVLFSLRAASRRRYAGLFHAGRVSKVYEAVASLPADADAGRREWLVETRIEKGEPWFRSRHTEGPVNAATRIRLLERAGLLGRFEALPSTGKQHQIRLHFARLGAQIVNDFYYPELRPDRKQGYDAPLQLLARELAFDDPVTGRALVFTSARALAWPPGPASAAGSHLDR